VGGACSCRPKAAGCPELRGRRIVALAMPDNRAALARCREQHRLVVELGSFALSGTATLDVLLQRAAELAARGIGITRSKVMEYKPADDMLLLRAGVGWREGVVGRLMMSADSSEPQGHAFRVGEPLVIEDLSNCEYTIPELLREHGIMSTANAPIMVDERVWGVLELDSERSHSLTGEDTLLLQGFAHILGNAIEHQLATAALAAAAVDRQVALNEREVLFRELHHRVANNFMAIMGSVEMLARKATIPDTRAVLEKLVDRVASISDAHEQLSSSEIEKDISLGVYLERLVATLRVSDPIRVSRAIGDATVPLRTAVRLGMIVNELVTNSLKHAFTEAGGTVSVSFSANRAQGTGRLVLSDDGRGMVAGDQPGGSGTLLVKALVEQIGGALDVATQPGAGTATEVRFPLGSGSDRA
jgi:two-component system, sensor histidine kinase PdtaS